MDYSQESQSSGEITRGAGGWDFEIKAEVTKMAANKVKGMGNKIPGMMKTTPGMGKTVRSKNRPKLGDRVPGMSVKM